MWYSAGDNFEPDVICYAESSDGISWLKYEKPVLAAYAPHLWEKKKVGGCCVKFDGVHHYTIAPYARYTAVEWDMVKLFIDGGMAFGSYKDAGTYINVGLRPGVAISLTDEVSFVAHLGFFGFENYSPKGGGNSGSTFGVDFSNNCSFGVYFNF